MPVVSLQVSWGLVFCPYTSTFAVPTQEFPRVHRAKIDIIYECALRRPLTVRTCRRQPAHKAFAGYGVGDIRPGAPPPVWDTNWESKRVVEVWCEAAT